MQNNSNNEKRSPNIDSQGVIKLPKTPPVMTKYGKLMREKAEKKLELVQEQREALARMNQRRKGNT